MKKFFSLLSLLVCISIGQVWGATMTIDFESAASAYTDWTITTITTKQTDSGVTAHGGSYFGSTDGKASGSIVTKNKVNPSSIQFYVSKLTTNTNAGSVWKIEVSSDNSTWTQVGDDQAAASGITKDTWTEVTRDLSSYSDVYVRVSYSGTTAKRCIDDLVLTTAEGGASGKTLSSVAVSGTPTKTAYNTGDEFDPAGLTVTGTYSDASTAAITSGITWAYNPSQTLVKGQTSIGVTATVSEITSAEYNVTGLSVTDLVVSSWQVISPASMATGDVVVLTMLKNNVYYAAPNNGGTNAPTATAVTVVGDKLASAPAETLQWTVTVVEEGVYQFSVGNDYLKCTDTNNGVKVGTGDYNTFDINTTNEKQYLHTTETMTSAENGRYLGIYNTQDWRCYTSVNNNIKDGSLVIFKDASAAAAVAKPTISGEASFVTSTEVSLSCSTNGATIYYTTNGNDPKTSGAAYSTPFTLTDGATVKAAAKVGNDWSAVASKEFTKVTVLTVAQARAAIDAGGDLTNKYVAGTISQIDSYNSTYNSITYWISDDGTTTNQLQVYSGLAGVVKSAFASENDLAVGDDVTVKGTLKKYSSTYEFDKNNTIEAYKPIARLAWSAESFNASLEGANTFPTLTNTNGVSVSYSSSDESAATINSSTGAISLVAVGSTTITASFAGNETYKAKSVSYTLNVASSLVTLTYNVDGGEAIDPVNVSALPNPLPTTTKAGKNFGGWFTDANKTVAAVAGATITENTTLYAKWLDPYTVADAKAVIDGLNGGTKDNQYVAGIISQIDSYSSQYHSITYWISADGTTTNQLEVYSGKGLNSANFSAVTDLELGDEVIVTGTLKKYNDVYEFDKNNYLYSLSRKASAGLEYAVTAVNKAVDDDAFINPLTNPNSVDVTYATSDDQVAEVANDGTVTIIGEGSATITASFAGNETYSAAQVSYTLTVSATPVVLTDYYEKVTSTANITDGTYLIVYEDGNVAFNGGLETLDAAGNTVDVLISEGKIAGNAAIDAAVFTIDVTAGTIKSASNKYIGVSSNSNGLKTSDDASTYPHTFSIDDDGNAVIAAAFDGSTMSLRYNTASNQARFRYYKDNGQQAIQLYKLHGEVVKPAAGLTWDPADDIVLTVGDAFTAPTLLNPNNIATADITIASDNEDLATVSNGVVSLVANATGTATITATFAGNETYKAANVSYTITVNAVSEPADNCDGSDDFLDTEDTGNPTSYKDRSTPNGWSAVNAGYKVIDEKAYWMINGKTSAVGVITSPELSDGIATLKFRYANTNSESNGVSVKIEIKQGEEVVKEYTLTKANADVVQNTVYTETIENINVEGTFQIVITNLSPSNNTGNKDRVSIGRFCWTSYSAQPDDPDPVYNFEEVRSGLEVGRHYTICLEKKIMAVRGATFWGINNCSEDNLTVYLEMQQPPFDAGKPFIFHATAETLEVAYEGDAVGAPITNGALRGTFSYMDADALAAAGSNIYMMYNNALHPLGTNNHLDAHRAYLLFDALVPGTPAPGRTVRSMPMHGNVTTDIEDAEASAKPMKKLIDGQLFIQCGEKLYDATGRQVK